MNYPQPSDAHRTPPHTHRPQQYRIGGGCAIIGGLAAGRPARHGGGGPPGGQRAGTYLEQGTPTKAGAPGNRRLPPHRGFQPPALCPRTGRGPGARRLPGRRRHHRHRPADAGMRRHLDRLQRRLRRRLRRRRIQPRQSAAGRPGLYLKAAVAVPRTGTGLLLRRLQRGAVAAVPQRLYRAVLSAVRLGNLPRRQPRIRPPGHRRGRRAPGGGVHPGLPSGAAAANVARRRPRQHHRPVLAHSLAQLRNFPHLPLAGRAARRAAGQRYARLSHRRPLQQLYGVGPPHPGLPRLR